MFSGSWLAVQPKGLFTLFVADWILQLHKVMMAAILFSGVQVLNMWKRSIGRKSAFTEWRLEEACVTVKADVNQYS